MSLLKPRGKSWGYWFKKFNQGMERSAYYKNHRCYHKWALIHDDKEFKRHYQCNSCKKYRTEFY